MFSSKDLFFTPTSGAYTVSKSLRFREASTTYLNRTPGGAGSQTTWTWSAWVKRGRLTYAGSGGITTLFGWQGTVSGQSGAICFTTGAFTGAGDSLAFFQGANNYRVTNAVLRDPSAWYHIVAVWDSNNGTDAQRCRLYVNGVEASYATSNTITSGTTLNCNNTVAHAIGADITNNTNVVRNYFDGYMADVNFIGGSALTPSSFGEYDTNGVWQPKAYTGSYSGTNSFYLKFTTVGATSGSNTGYGQDFSGNGNYWTTNNFGTTSTATTYDSMLDSPTNATGDIGNYAVLNPINAGMGTTIIDGNLTFTGIANTNEGYVLSTMGVDTGSFYFEVQPSSFTGVLEVYISNRLGITAGYRSDGTKDVDGVNSAYGASWTASNIIGCAFNAGTKTVTFYKDNASQGSFTYTGSGLVYAGVVVRGAGSANGSVNFGQRPFQFSVPSTFSTLNTQNLTTPTIANGAQYMAAVTYQGATAPNTVTTTSSNSGNNPNAVTFQPDLVWIKARTATTSHKLTDSTRGVTKAISTDSTAAESTDTNGLTAFTASGFTVGSDTNYNNTTGPVTYVAWEWKEGVSQGFDIVSYAGDNTSNRNISHNLGVAPAFVWVKSLSTGSFYIYHQNLTGSTYFLKCNSTDGTNAQTNTNTPWGTGNWSSTQFMVTNNATNNLNASSTNYIGYLWAAIAGYSSFGSYTGNGLADGPFVYTGFRPRWIMGKCSSAATSDWFIYDTSRATYNASTARLYADTSGAETTGLAIDILSNGFKFRALGGQGNDSGSTYIFAAFAENPFKISRAR